MHLKLSQSASARLPDGTEVTLTDLDAALLAWLALEGPTARNRLAALLWPGSSAEAAGNSLRQRLFRLKRQCGMAPVLGSAVLALAEGDAQPVGVELRLPGESQHRGGSFRGMNAGVKRLDPGLDCGRSEAEREAGAARRG